MKKNIIISSIVFMLLIAGCESESQESRVPVFEKIPPVSTPQTSTQNGYVLIDSIPLNRDVAESSSLISGDNNDMTNEPIPSPIEAEQSSMQTDNATDFLSEESTECELYIEPDERSLENTPMESKCEMPLTVIEPEADIIEVEYDPISYLNRYDYMIRAYSDEEKTMYFDQCNTFLANGQLPKVDSFKTMFKIYDYYNEGYRFGSNARDHVYIDYYSVTTDEKEEEVYTQSGSAQTYEERKTLVDAMVEKYGLNTDGCPREIIQSTVERVHESMTYDLDYTEASMEECLNADRGVCWTMAQIDSVLLNLEGIPTRRVIGASDGTNVVNHEWIECLLDDAWVPIEATAGYNCIRDYQIDRDYVVVSVY